MNTSTAITFCTCENQSLLSPGCTCEICMGTVPDKYTRPVRKAAHLYGPDYFEALEQMQIDGGCGPDLAA